MTIYFKRILGAAITLSLLGTASSLSAQTIDELKRENERLRSQITEMQYQTDSSHNNSAVSFHDDHAHDDGDHGHSHGDYAPEYHDTYCNNYCCDSNYDCCWGPHFDYCLIYDDHHGGYGHCDVCGCNDGHGHGGHGHDHMDYGPAYHHSIEGHPILHAARTEFFFAERHMHLRLVDVRGADDGEVDELEFEAELVYALNDRFVLIGTAPLIHLNPENDPSTTGFGDLKFGLRMVSFNGERDGVLFGMDVVAPTGDASRDLGGGHAALLPSVNWVHDFGCGTAMFNVLTWEIPVDVDSPEDHFQHDFVLLHTFLGMEHAPLFRYLTTSFEVNTDAIINGPNSGQTVVDATCGLTWLMGDENEVSVGYSFPISGDRNFDQQLFINFIKHM